MRNAAAYYNEENWDSMEFPEVGTRHIAHVVRNIEPIPDYRAVVDLDTGHTFAIVKSGYKAIHHQEILNAIDAICEEFPEYGKPTKEVWTQNYGGRVQVRYTFKDVDFEIAKLSNGSADIVHPTIEGFGSHDTSLVMKMLVGGFRTVCTNGLTVGKVLGEYKKKHTDSLNIEHAKKIINKGMQDYSEVTGLWTEFAERLCSNKELVCYNSLGFNKGEQEYIEDEIKRSGKLITWDKEEPKNCKAELSSWGIMQILTDTVSHKVDDIVRKDKINSKIMGVFN